MLETFHRHLAQYRQCMGSPAVALILTIARPFQKRILPSHEYYKSYLRMSSSFELQLQSRSQKMVAFPNIVDDAEKNIIISDIFKLRENHQPEKCLSHSSEINYNYL